MAFLLDASTTEAGAVLHQSPLTELQPRAFFSKTFSPTEWQYSTSGRELLASYFAIRHFKHYPEGSHVVVSALRNHSTRYRKREIRQLNSLSQVDLQLRLVKRAENEAVDALAQTQIPPAFRRTVFEALHGPAHAGVKPSGTLLYHDSPGEDCGRMYSPRLDRAWPARERKFTRTLNISTLALHYARFSQVHVASGC